MYMFFNSFVFFGNFIYRGGSRNFREEYHYHSQWFSDFIAIFDGNYISFYHLLI